MGIIKYLEFIRRSDMGLTPSRNDMIVKSKRVSMNSFKRVLAIKCDPLDRETLLEGIESKLQEHGLLGQEGFQLWYNEIEQLPFPEVSSEDRTQTRQFKKWKCMNENIVY